MLLGGPGADMLDGGGSADVMRGNGGPDTVTYVTRRKPVDVTLSSGQHDDGEQGEEDHITSTENAIGGHRERPSRRLRRREPAVRQRAATTSSPAWAADDVLNGGPGKDTCRATAQIVPVPAGYCDQTGDDELQGDSGDDELFGDTGKDKLLGEAGDDYLLGAEGDDDLQGGEGADVLWGDNGGRSSKCRQRGRQAQRRGG